MVRVYLSFETLEGYYRQICCYLTGIVRSICNTNSFYSNLFQCINCIIHWKLTKVVQVIVCQCHHIKPCETVSKEKFEYRQHVGELIYIWGCIGLFNFKL